MLITSKDNNKVKEVRKLLNKRYSLEKGLFVIEGENLVSEALKNNVLKELYVLDGYNCNLDFEYNNISHFPLNILSNLPNIKLLDLSCNNYPFNNKDLESFMTHLKNSQLFLFF